MLIRYKLFRASKPDEVFNAEMIKVNIENDDHLVAIDDILTGILAQHIQQLPEVKKYGIGYVGRMEIVNLEVTDEDNIDLTEEQFRVYMQSVNPLLSIIWNKTTNNTEPKEKPVKLELHPHSEDKND